MTGNDHEQRSVVAWTPTINSVLLLVNVCLTVVAIMLLAYELEKINTLSSSIDDYNKWNYPTQAVVILVKNCSGKQKEKI